MNIVACYLYRLFFIIMTIIIIFLNVFCNCFFLKTCTYFFDSFFTYFLGNTIPANFCVFTMVSFSLELQKSTRATSLQAAGSRFPEVSGPASMLLLQCRWVLLTGACSAGYRSILPSKMPLMRAPVEPWALGMGSQGSRWTMAIDWYVFSAWHVMWVCQNMGAILKIPALMLILILFRHKLCFWGIPVFPPFWEKTLMWFHKTPHPHEASSCATWQALGSAWHCSTSFPGAQRREGGTPAIPIATRSMYKIKISSFEGVDFFWNSQICIFWRCLKMFWKFPRFSTKSSYLGVHETALQVGQITIHHHILSI